jgi:glutathione synthase/RimK-type ligase-like ATP-grasp enzyme
MRRRPHVKIALFGAAADPHGQALAGEARRRGAEVAWVEPDALERAVPLLDDAGEMRLGGVRLDDADAALVRAVPLPSAPAVEQGGKWVLHADWFARYMQSRERAALHASWLRGLEHAGVPVVNPLHAGASVAFKPFQLRVLRRLGAPLPRTLITNDPGEVRRFALAVGPGEPLVYKPLEGGATARLLDDQALERLELLRRSPAIFQERIHGADVRAVVVGDRVVSAVEIVTPEQHLDFRADPVYARGEAEYRAVALPPEVERLCVQAARACGLIVAGVDLKRSGGAWVFLELNSAPLYLDVERKTGDPITAAIIEELLARARG